MAKRELNPIEQRLAQWAQEAEDGPSIPDYDPEFSASFPNLWVLLSWRSIGNYDRSPGTLSVSADGTGWRLSYYDPSARRRCTVAANSLTEGLRKLDAAVGAPDTVWSGGKPRSQSFRKRKTE